jgi:hypothetical protein
VERWPLSFVSRHPSPRPCALRSDRPKRRRASLRASVSSDRSALANWFADGSVLLLARPGPLTTRGDQSGKEWCTASEGRYSGPVIDPRVPWCGNLSPPSRSSSHQRGGSGGWPRGNRTRTARQVGQATSGRLLGGPLRDVAAEFSDGSTGRPPPCSSMGSVSDPPAVGPGCAHTESRRRRTRPPAGARLSGHRLGDGAPEAGAGRGVGRRVTAASELHQEGRRDLPYLGAIDGERAAHGGVLSFQRRQHLRDRAEIAGNHHALVLFPSQAAGGD